MKKKLSVIFFMVLFFSAVGAFHYDGSKRVSEAGVNSKEGIPAIKKEIEIEPKEYTTDAETSHPTTLDSSPATSSTKPDTQPTDAEINTQKITESDAPNEKKSDQTIVKESKPAKSKESENPKTKEGTPSSEEDIYVLDGKTYRLFMDKTKVDPNSNLVNFIDAAIKHGAKIYGLDQSDMFIIVKNGKHIGGFSAGILNIKIEHANLVKAMYPENRRGYKGIEHNIDLVLQTGAHVSVEYDSQVEGYSLYVKNGYLYVGTY